MEGNFLLTTAEKMGILEKSSPHGATTGLDRSGWKKALDRQNLLCYTNIRPYVRWVSTGNQSQEVAQDLEN